MVGSPPAAPPLRWTSAYMLAPRNAAASMGSPEPGAQAASVVAARAATWRSRASAGSARTWTKSRPSRTALDHRRREAQPAAAVAPTTANGLTRCRTSLASCPPQPQSARAPGRQGERDGPGAVEPAAGDAARPHHDHRAAGAAEVAPERDPDQLRVPPELDRAPLVPLAQTVAVEPQETARGAARGLASRAAPRASLVHRRRPGEPNLDVDLHLYESNVAPVTCGHRPGARRGACGHTLPVTRFRGRRRAGAPSSAASIPSPTVTASVRTARCPSPAWRATPPHAARARSGATPSSGVSGNSGAGRCRSGWLAVRPVKTSGTRGRPPAKGSAPRCTPLGSAACCPSRERRPSP